MRHIVDIDELVSGTLYLVQSCFGATITTYDADADEFWSMDYCQVGSFEGVFCIIELCEES